jgi:hypothetical protein
MKFAYADPPYLGQAKSRYGDSAYDSIDAHRELVQRLEREYSDGWAMSASSPSLRLILPLCPEDCRVAAWVKPFAAFRPNVKPAYAWEPVIFRGGRPRTRKDETWHDWHSENITMRRGFVGCKPPGFAQWIVRLLNADVTKGDTITDLFHGSGAMLGVWRPDAAQMMAQGNGGQVKPGGAA